MIDWKNFSLTLAFAIAPPLLAQVTDSVAEDDLVLYELEPFVVEAHAFSRVDDYSIVSTDFLDAEELARLAQGTLGETLSWQPGVSSTYFGPGASRPVIRGVEGFRVRMLQDTVGTLDVSETSPDHGVALEPLLIQSVDIHRGPSALLFGNAAIGGAVNATTRNFPEELPQQVISAAVENRYDSASNGTTTAGYTQLVMDDFVLTGTGSTRNASDYAIPGQARTEAYETTFQPLVNDPVLNTTVPVDNPEGMLPNTFHESTSGSVGLTWLPQSAPGMVGAAYARYASRYGVPWQYGGDPNDLFGYTALDLRHERFDLRGRIEPQAGWLDTLQVHLGYADYGHDELFTGRGKDADKAFNDTLYDQHAMEGRLEWFHQLTESLEGVWGVQLQRQDLAASFLAAPPVEASRFRNAFQTENRGLFLLETLTVGDWTFQAGARYEKQHIMDTSLEAFGIVPEHQGRSRSVAGSVTWSKKELGFLDALSITPALSSIERIPTATERYAFWPNPAIQRFLIGGDKDGTPLANEQSVGAEIGIEARKGDWAWRLNLYRYEYDNFVFLQDIKGVGNPAQYIERQARFTGFESEVSWQHWFQPNDARVQITLMADYVEGHNVTDDQPLPRMPPLRIGSRAEVELRALAAGLEFRHAFAQKRVQPETDVVLPELPTGSYNEVNLDLSYELPVAKTTATVFLRATNLLDEERRVPTSFIKDVAPLPGRSVSVGMRLTY